MRNLQDFHEVSSSDQRPHGKERELDGTRSNWAVTYSPWRSQPVPLGDLRLRWLFRMTPCWTIKYFIPHPPVIGCSWSWAESPLQSRNFLYGTDNCVLSASRTSAAGDIHSHSWREILAEQPSIHQKPSLLRVCQMTSWAQRSSGKRTLGMSSLVREHLRECWGRTALKATWYWESWEKNIFWVVGMTGTTSFLSSFKMFFRIHLDPHF